MHQQRATNQVAGSTDLFEAAQKEKKIKAVLELPLDYR